MAFTFTSILADFLDSAPTPTPAQKKQQPLPRFGMAAALAGMGVLHFAARDRVESIVPPQLPGTRRFYNYASGLWEIGTAGLLAVPRTRRVGGLSAAALFASVWPANMYHAAVDHKTLGKKLYHAVRLPLQLPAMKYAWDVWEGRR